MNKGLKMLLTGTAAAASRGSSPYAYDYMSSLTTSKGGTQKTYKNKNANIEYYIDEKGHIRKRKINRNKKEEDK